MNQLIIDTVVTRLLKARDIAFELRTHEPLQQVHALAKARGISPSIMVKSLLLQDMGGQLALACVPGDHQVDPRLVRAALGCRRMTCVAAKDVAKLTGFAIGTVTPIALTQPLPILFDHQLAQHAVLSISSGDPRAGVLLAQQDLVALCQPQWHSLCRDQTPQQDADTCADIK
ncbi:Cys-tRNA(Pro)/Cys-tRNA(Cys) deacylase YbaK [Vibrio stylophorae]|uniref:Cys-tRNA(Pro)/Cys-tRNA(Cys) deacylase YbaK n=1 Tax=Vibrio stylophorae TaxID=659351 RepID=A0ABM8ZRU8_9VIBR|nr:YbaK/EbsC family protein [Vibrio stylophorae]CAH0532625.1 Cys-tRNA(Pro)/Cys-tRNA(Cys) deacylase YbaK [Vibrio stylophorae]